jgi:hypothetical protein
MNMRHRFFVAVFDVFMIFPLHAGERTIPVDFFLMIDKSISMAEPGKFDSMHQWVHDQLLSQILIDGDWITVWQFYGKAEHLMTIDVKTDTDREKIIKNIDMIKPNGKYTDIGVAMDTIKAAFDKRGVNGRHKVLLLLTDLRQEAPWSSKYAGVMSKFESPYLTEARILQHDGWYEITLDIGIQDTVGKTTKELFAAIQKAKDEPDSRENTLAAAKTAAAKADGTTAETGGNAKTANKSTTEQPSGGTLPLLIPIVVSSLVIVAGTIVAVLIVHNNRKKKEEKQAT